MAHDRANKTSPVAPVSLITVSLYHYCKNATTSSSNHTTHLNSRNLICVYNLLIWYRLSSDDHLLLLMIRWKLENNTVGWVGVDMAARLNDRSMTLFHKKLLTGQWYSFIKCHWPVNDVWMVLRPVAEFAFTKRHLPVNDIFLQQTETGCTFTKCHRLVNYPFLCLEKVRIVPLKNCHWPVNDIFLILKKCHWLVNDGVSKKSGWCLLVSVIDQSMTVSRKSPDGAS